MPAIITLATSVQFGPTEGRLAATGCAACGQRVVRQYSKGQFLPTRASQEQFGSITNRHITNVVVTSIALHQIDSQSPWRSAVVGPHRQLASK